MVLQMNSNRTSRLSDNLILQHMNMIRRDSRSNSWSPSSGSGSISGVLQDLWRSQRITAEQRPQASPFIFGPSCQPESSDFPPFVSARAAHLQMSVDKIQMFTMQPGSPLASASLRIPSSLLGAPMGPPPLGAMHTSSFSSISRLSTGQH